MKFKLRNGRQVFRGRETRKAQQGRCSSRKTCWFFLLASIILSFVVYDLSLPDDEYWYIPPTVEFNFSSNQFPLVSIGSSETTQVDTNSKESRLHPRVVQVDFDMRPAQNPTTLRLNRTIVIPYYDYGWRLMRDPHIDVDGRQECAPMEWQTKRFLSCNSMHEMYLEGLTYINCGGSRCAFEFSDMDGTPIVLKVKTLDEWFRHKELENARRDALVMERLTSSPYVASIYGACGTSQIVEYSAYGNLFDWMKLTRHGQRELPTPVEKLKLAIQIATGVADMHSIDQDQGLVSMAHNDVCCHQFMMVDGTFKLGDFHLSTFVKKNLTSGHECEEWNRGMNSAIDKVRAPEELDGGMITPLDKVDVFLMGNVMYYIMTQKWIFEGVTTAETKKQLIDGNRSDFGNVPTHPAEKAVEKAIRWSWTHIPKERPTAREVSSFLKDALKELDGQEYDVVRVSVPPLPSDYDFSDAEFYENLGQDLDGNPV